MLVLNRRPGESIIVEPDVHVTVHSVTERRVWMTLEAPARLPPVRFCASVLTPEVARLEVGPLAGVEFGGDEVTVTTGAEDHPAAAARATVALDRRVGESVRVGGLTVRLASLAKGSPCIELGGPVIGEAFCLTVIRPAGSYVRLGVDAPGRRVYREELWEAVQAQEADAAVAASGVAASGVAAAAAAVEPAPA